MAGSKISTLVTHTVMLGSAAYGSPLTIIATGRVAPASYGAIGVDAPAGLASAVLKIAAPFTAA